MTPPISAVINGILFALSFWAGLWLVQIAVLTAMRVAASRRIWFVARSFSWPVRMLFGSVFGGSLVFQSLAFALRDAGKVEAARAMALARIAEPDVPSWSRNAAIDLLISAGAYEAALRAEPQPYTPANSSDALGLTLIQVNLAEAEYNLGRWDAAEERLRPLDPACGAFDIARAGLLQQRAWISAQRGRGDEALDLCAMTGTRSSAFAGLRRITGSARRVGTVYSSGRRRWRSSGGRRRRSRFAGSCASVIPRARRSV
jgi:hypothetical protein